MAEEGSVYELEGLKKQLESLFSRYPSDELRADSKPFCSEFCQLVEKYASRWQVPLPQLRILEIALCYFARASIFFTSNCDHVLHTLSSLALSVFELLLFFDQKDFHQEPLKQFTVTFQECHLALARHQNVHLLQVERLVQGGGLWAGPALQSILSESSLPQSEVDGCISSELPVFFELRVRYLLSCERVSEAMALAKCCARYSIAGQHLFFLQVYLTWLLKTSQHDRLHKEVAEFNGKDAIHLICSLECEEKDELLLALSRAFLSEQLRRGDMYYLCDLVFIWTKLHSRLNTSKQALLEEIHQLILSATNVNSIFPFIRAILQELGEDGVQFSVELCANALGSCLPCDVITKSLIYKTIAGLLPNDLEVSRACALLVFFLERTVEAYKMVYLLYMHPDQEYHVERSPIRNHVRFETLQIIKKDLYFDPEFWNLIALRTNCLKLMSGKVVSGALEEIMEDKWILSYCAKEPTSRPRSSVCRKGSKGAVAKKRRHKDDRHHKEGADTASKRLKGSPGKTRLNVDYTLRKKGNQGSSSEPLRRSFWQLERLQDNVAGVGRGELRRATRLSEKNPPKRRIRKPKWLLEDSGNPGKNNLQKIKKHGSKHHVVKRSENIELKNSAKPSHLMVRENSRHQKGFSLESVKPATLPQVILELSLPDNELGTFTEDACNRQRGFPQVLFYRSTVKLPATSQPAKTVHRKEVILRARDAAMFAQQLHCYARRQKGKGKGPNIQGSVSTITRSSVQGSPPKDPRGDFCEKSDAEMKGGITSQTPAAAEVTKSPVFEKVLEAQATKAVSRKTFSGRELCEKSAEITEAPILDKVLQAQTIASARGLCDESAVEMKVTIASTAATVTPGKASKAVKDASKTTTLAEVLQTSPVDNNQMEVTDKIPPVSNDPTTSQCRDVLRDGRQGLNSMSSQAETGKNVIAQAKGDTSAALTAFGNISEVNVTDVPCENDTSGGTTVTTCTPTDQGSINDISALTLVTEMVTELSPEALTRDLENHKLPAQTESSYTPGSKALLADVQGEEEATQDSGSENSDLPESEESKLEFCCTFCNKVFKGSRVVAHAMFHYRKDECMFCRTMFKDDLLAMMHLSDHIEKLKRSKELAGNNDQETKEVSTRKTSATAKTTNVPSVRRSSGRPRKSPDGPTSASLPHSTPSGSRRLRSNDKAAEAQSLHEKKHDSSKHLNNTTPVHKVNGHIGKNKGHDGPEKETVTSEAKQPLAQQEISQGRTEDRTEDSSLQKNQDLAMDSSATSEQLDEEFNRSTKTESMQILKTASKQSETVVEERNAEPQERVCCPADGCGWFTDLSKNRVALLYHVLEDHYGEVKPLELAFRVGNSKCSCCMRVMWSFEHFQHHVERHRLTPRHPCLHQGCAARFKTGIETRRHTRRHNPLQAVCCHPGCSQLFICLWALNLHEREHYGSKLTKSDKNTNEQTSDKRSQEEENTTAVNKTESVKAARKSRGEAADISSTGKLAQAPLPATVGASEESKETNRTTDSHVLKNLSNKDTSTPPTGPILRLRQTLRKVINTQSLVRQDIKARYKFKKKQVKRNTKGPKRRGRPPKPKEPVHDENTTTGQNNQTLVEKNAPLQSLPKAAEASNVSNESNEGETIQQVRDVVKTKSISKQLKKNHLKHKGVSHNSSTAIVTAHSLADKTHKLTAKNVHRVKKRAAPKESGGQTASSDSSKSKKHKVANGEANAKKDKSCPLDEQEEKAKVENSGSMPSGSGNSVPAVPASSLDVGTAPSITSGERKQKLPAAGKAKKSLVKKEAKREKRPHAASSDSGKTNRKHKDINRKEDKKTIKDKKKAALKSVDPQVEAKASDSSPDVEGKAKDATTDATLDSSGSSVPAATAGGLNEKTSPPAATEENMQKAKSKKSHVTKKSDPSKANKKRKSVHTEGDTEIVKKKCKDQGVKSPSETKSKTEVRPLAEGKAEVAEEEGKTSSPGYTVITNGQAAREEAKNPVLKDVLAGYSSKPYMRPPPTAYLDEKYITMPKRRKQQQQQQPSSPRSPPPQHNHVTKALQRRRCANCFATFNSADDLQSHLQLQKCSDLFGFDSDDEGAEPTAALGGPPPPTPIHHPHPHCSLGLRLTAQNFSDSSGRRHRKRERPAEEETGDRRKSQVPHPKVSAEGFWSSQGEKKNQVHQTQPGNRTKIHHRRIDLLWSSFQPGSQLSSVSPFRQTHSQVDSCRTLLGPQRASRPESSASGSHTEDNCGANYGEDGPTGKKQERRLEAVKREKEACFMSTLCERLPYGLASCRHYVNVCLMGAARGHISHGQQRSSLGNEMFVPSRLRMRSCHEHRVLKAHQTVIDDHIWDPKVSDTGLKSDVSMKGEWRTVNFKKLS